MICLSRQIEVPVHIFPIEDTCIDGFAMVIGDEIFIFHKNVGRALEQVTLNLSENSYLLDWTKSEDWMPGSTLNWKMTTAVFGCESMYIDSGHGDHFSVGVFKMGADRIFGMDVMTHDRPIFIIHPDIEYSIIK